MEKNLTSKGKIYLLIEDVATAFKNNTHFSLNHNAETSVVATIFVISKDVVNLFMFDVYKVFIIDDD